MAKITKKATIPPAAMPPMPPALSACPPPPDVGVPPTTVIVGAEAVGEAFGEALGEVDGAAVGSGVEGGGGDGGGGGGGGARTPSATTTTSFIEFAPISATFSPDASRFSICTAAPCDVSSSSVCDAALLVNCCTEASAVSALRVVESTVTFFSQLATASVIACSTLTVALALVVTFVTVSLLS